MILENLSERWANEIEARARKRMWKTVAAILGGTGILGVAGLYAVLESAARNTDKAIAEQFAKPRVQETMERVVATEAKKLLDLKIKPAVAEARQFIARQKGALRVEVDTLKKEFEGELESLREHASFWEEVRKIQVLQDRAIAGEAEALDSLMSSSFPDERLRRRAHAAVLSVKSAYVASSRKAGSMPPTLVDGEWVEEEDFPTGLVLSLLQDGIGGQPPTEQVWQPGETVRQPLYWLPRARLVYILGRYRQHRKCEEAPDALIEAATTDSSLWVRKEALSAFYKHMPEAQEAVNDVLGGGEAAAWWREQRSQKLKERNYTQCITATGKID